MEPENKTKHPSFFNRHRRDIIVLAIFALGVFIFYGNTLVNGYIHDDHGQVEDNIYLRSFNDLPRIFTGCIWESAMTSCKGTWYYRPIQSLSYLVTYQISANPWLFHLVNLAYYIAVVFLVFVLARLLTKDYVAAFLAGLIFLIHPLNTETVNWIATVPELLYTLFALLTTIYYFLYRRDTNPKRLKLVYLFFALGVLAKEPAVFMPFVFLALDLGYFKKKIAEMFSWPNLKPYVICVAIFAVYMVMRFSVLGGLGSDAERTFTFGQRAHIFFDFLGAYIYKMFWPYPLNWFYTFHPQYELNLPFLAETAIGLAFFALGAAALKKGWGTIFTCLVWFFAFLMPSLVFINSIGENLFAERRVFASTAGFAILAALLLSRLWQNKRQPQLARVTVVALAVLATAASFTSVYARNQLWKDDIILDSVTLDKSPDADLIRYNLAVLYKNKGDMENAKKEYKIIIDRGVWVGLYKAYNNLGDIARQEKDYGLAAEYFSKSLQNNPQHREAFNSFGAMYFEQGKYLEGLPYICKALLIDPSFAPANKNFDYAAGKLQQMDDAAFGKLLDEILAGKIFTPATKENSIRFKNKDCSGANKDASGNDSCLYTFSASLQKNEFVFPFLIAGKTSRGQIVRTVPVSFDPATSEMKVAAPAKFAGSAIDFFFPTCESIYYKAAAPAAK